MRCEQNGGLSSKTGFFPTIIGQWASHSLSLSTGGLVKTYLALTVFHPIMTSGASVAGEAVG